MSAVFSTPQESTGEAVHCPYCHRELRWVRAKWLTHGLFECECCGEFSDFRPTKHQPPPPPAPQQ